MAESQKVVAMNTIPTAHTPPRSGQNVNARGFAIYTEKLSKSYGTARGISELNLQVREGEIFGFLGPNGAGKTTTIRLLLNLIFPTSGLATVNGLDSQQDSVEIKKQIGYLPGEFSLYPGLTGAQTLEYFSNLRGGVVWNYVLELAGRLELDLSKKFRQYSRGNKQKVGIIQALMHRPRLLILDEPTSGLDPLNQREFYKLLQEIRQKGSTVFFSSHIMSEVEKTCDRVAIIREGRLVRVGGLEELTGIKTQQLELTFAGTAPLVEIEGLEGVSHLEQYMEGTHEALRCVAQAEALDNLLKIATNHHLINIATREPSLEEIFLQYYSNGN
jgi:ABC-2 type transport system ATP-binding protein